MKITKTITKPPQPAEILEVVTHVKCDLCNARGEPICHDGTVRWFGRNVQDETIKTTVVVQTGHNHSEKGHWNQVIFHICGECWTQQLKPFLEKQGAEPTINRISW